MVVPSLPVAESYAQEDLGLAGIQLDACEAEQSALCRQYVLAAGVEDCQAVEWSSRGHRSVSPFAPCAATRIPHILAAARLTPDDVFLDLGCGDGRVLLEASARYGCRSVGVEVDAACLEKCRRSAAESGLESLCTWRLADMSEFPDDFFLSGRTSADDTAPLPVPTVCLLFITGHGLVAIADWLHRAWLKAFGKVRILTCVEALDTARDYNDGVFAETNTQGWTVVRDPVHAKYGVFVVPPSGCSAEAWQAQQPKALPSSRQFADQAPVAFIRGVYSIEDIKSIEAFVESVPPPSDGDDQSALAGVLFGNGDEWVDAEDAVHALREHRVLHLHRDGVDGRPLQRVRAKLLRTMYQADADLWGLLRGRSVYVRSFEHHSYEPGGSVMDPEHRDDGSLLTASVLLGRSEGCQGGIFRAWDAHADAWREFDDVHPGDAVVFVSEKRHNVTPLKAGFRQSMVMELWDQGVTRHNRHR